VNLVIGGNITMSEMIDIYDNEEIRNQLSEIMGEKSPTSGVWSSIFN
jgi:hypothetical protein